MSIRVELGFDLRRACCWCRPGAPSAPGRSAPPHGRPAISQLRPTFGSAATRRRRAWSSISAKRSTCAPSRSPIPTVSSSTCRRSPSSFRPRTGETGRGLIKAFRYGLVMQGGSRLVIDLARPARIDKAFVLDAANDQPARLVLDLAAIDRETFMRAIALENRVAGQPASRCATVTPSRAADPRPLVVIDPGMAASTTAPGPQAARWRRPSFSNSR